MSPYRSHSQFNERRMRRLVRKQTRLDKRILQRAERRYHRDLNIQHAKDLGLLLFMGVFMVYSYLLMIQGLALP